MSSMRQRGHSPIGTCEYCMREAEIDVHHRDKNRKNNDNSNLARLCRWCHREDDGRQSHVPLPETEVRRQYHEYFPRA